MMTINEIVYSPLFRNAETRSILLPVFMEQVETLLKDEEEVC